MNRAATTLSLCILLTTSVESNDVIFTDDFESGDTSAWSTVFPPNNPPTANDDAYTLEEDSGLTNLDVLGNDTTAPDVGEILTITSTSTSV